MSEVLVRLELETRDGSLAPGLAARVADAAWLLGRQWMLGELEGDDGGTPIEVSIAADLHRLSRFQVGRTVIPFSPEAVPLDAIAECVAVRAPSVWTLRERIDAGRELVRQLCEAGGDTRVAELASSYAFPAADVALRSSDPVAAALLDVVAGRIPDGALLAEEFLPTRKLTARELDSGALTAALDGWRTWLRASLLEPPPGAKDSAWQTDRLEYRFSVGSASLGDAFLAPGHRGAELDWYAFDRFPGSPPSDPPQKLNVTARPAPLTFRGMPASRYWEFEDAKVDLGSVEASACDLARLALLEFAFVHGNDVFLVPLQLPVGSFCEIQSLVVRDTFGFHRGVPSAVRPATAGTNGWSFLATTGADGKPHGGLFVPAVARHALRGPLREEVTLQRDEVANLVWSIERTLEGSDGVGRAVPPSAPPVREPPLRDAPLSYSLMEPGRPGWYPLDLQVLAPGGERRLVLGVWPPAATAPSARLLPRPGDAVADEEIGREGLTLQRRFAFARAADGTPFVWEARSRVPRRHEAPPPTRFDQIVRGG
jgi:hypothetical protein